MKIEKALSIRDKAKVRLYDVFSAAKIYKPTSEKLHQSILSVYNSLPKDTPYWVTSYLDGVKEVLRDDLYKNHLEFCYVVENSIWSVVKHSKRYYRDFGILCSDLAKEYNKSGHYWFDTNKPFFLTSKDEVICKHGVTDDSFTSGKCTVCEEQKCPHVN